MHFVLSGYGKSPQTTLAYYEMNSEDQIRELWSDQIESPSFLCQGDDYLFTITENDDTAIVYCYENVKNQFIQKDVLKLKGSALCHITYSSKNKALIGACYGSGTVFSIQVNHGFFGEIYYNEVQIGDSPDTITRTHCVLLNREENQLIVTNIALDLVYFYDVKEGLLILSEILELPKSIGPRHCIFSKDETLIYIITEYSNEILIYSNDKNKELLQRISTLPEEFSGTSYCSTICFSKDYNYLYAANRGSDSITKFKVETDGTLHKDGNFSCSGECPRHMILTKDGKYLAVCNQNSDQVLIFTIDKKDGSIKSEYSWIHFKSPSGILEFIHRNEEDYEKS